MTSNSRTRSKQANYHLSAVNTVTWIIFVIPTHCISVPVRINYDLLIIVCFEHHFRSMAEMSSATARIQLYLFRCRCVSNMSRCGTGCCKLCQHHLPSDLFRRVVMKRKKQRIHQPTVGI